MVALSLWGLPDSHLAKDIMTPQQLSNTVRNSIVINLLFALGYCAFQLRRFWDE